MFGDPYRMVVVGTVSLVVFFIATFFYTYVYPKKKIHYLVLLLLLSFLPAISIFREGVYESGDFNLHIYRTIDFFNNLKLGIMMPSWAGTLNGTFGYPLFIFLNPLPYYAVSFLHTLGFDFILSMKLFLAGVFMLSGIGMYLFVNKLLKNEFSAFSAAVLYLFAPYHLVDQHFRVAIGEITVFTMLPLILLAVVNFFDKRSVLNFFLLSASVACVVFSHQAMAVFALGLVVLFSLILQVTRRQQKSTFLLFLLAFALGIGASWYSLYPYLFLTKYVISGSYITIDFVKPLQLFFSPWRFGLLFQGPHGELSTIIGYGQVAVVIFSLVYFFRKKKKKFPLQFIFWLAIFLLCVFMMLPVSRFFWDTIPLIHLAAISTRLLLFTTFAAAILGGILVTEFVKHKKIIWIFLILCVASTVLNWGNRRMITTVSEKDLISYVPMSTKTVEGWGIGTPKWRGNIEWEPFPPRNHLQVTNGTGTVLSSKWGEIDHRYSVNAMTVVSLVDNTWYFPGWNVLVDGKQVPIEYAKKENKGLIGFYVQPGIHNIRVFYQDLLGFTYNKIFSLVCLCVIIVGIMFGSSSSFIKKRTS